MNEHSVWRGKRKLSDDLQLLSVDEFKNISSKRPSLPPDCNAIDKNCEQKTRLDFIVIDGKWGTDNGGPIATNVQHVDLQYLDSSKNYYWIESGDILTLSDDNHLVKHEEIIETDFDNSTDSGSASSNASNAFTERSSQMSDSDSEESNLSWLLNFNVNSLFNTKTSPASLDYRHTNSGRRPQQPGTRKPPFTYTELIEQALREKGQLTVSGIYSWISEHFSYYKADDDRWKNSVRHNLSINPHFRKGGKAPHGAGHLWTVAPGPCSPIAQRKQQTLQQYLRREGNGGVANSPGEVTAAETAAATASILQPEDNNNNSSINKDSEVDSLQRSAGEILSGVRKRVEVQYLQHRRNGGDTDFLNPVSQEVVVRECGLLETAFELELSVSDHDIDQQSPLLVHGADDDLVSLPCFELAGPGASPHLLV